MRPLIIVPILLTACFVRPVHVVHDEITLGHTVRVVDVDVGSGDVRVVVEERSDTFIERTLRYQNHPPEVRAEVIGEVLTIRVECPKLATRCGGDHVIHLPTSADLLIDTGSGNVDVEDVNASMDLDTGSGNIELLDVTGDVVATTGSGDIRGVGIIAQSVSASTGSGNVELTLLQPTSSVWIDTGSGNVWVQTPVGAYRIATDTGSGNVEVRGVSSSPSSPNHIDIGTGSGDIDITGR